MEESGSFLERWANVKECHQALRLAFEGGCCGGSEYMEWGRVVVVVVVIVAVVAVIVVVVMVMVGFGMSVLESVVGTESPVQRQRHVLGGWTTSLKLRPVGLASTNRRPTIRTNLQVVFVFAVL